MCEESAHWAENCVQETVPQLLLYNGNTNGANTVIITWICQPTGDGPRLDHRARIHFGQVHFGVLTTSCFVPLALSSDWTWPALSSLIRYGKNWMMTKGDTGTPNQDNILIFIIITCTPPTITMTGTMVPREARQCKWSSPWSCSRLLNRPIWDTIIIIIGILSFSYSSELLFNFSI